MDFALNNFKWFFFMLKVCLPGTNELECEEGKAQDEQKFGHPEQEFLFEALKPFADMITDITHQFRFDSQQLNDSKFFEVMVQNLITDHVVKDANDHDQAEVEEPKHAGDHARNDQQ